MPKKITPEEYEQWLLDDGRGIVALEPYVKAKTKIMHQCGHGHNPWSACPDNIARGKGCPSCEIERRGISPKGYWTLGRCKKEALPYATRKDWKTGCPSAYTAACRKGWLDQCCAHMEAGDCATDADAVYVYEIRDDLGWTAIYKVGLTSWKNYDERIRRSNRKNDSEYRVLFLLRTTAGDARKIEQAILDSGTPFTDLPDRFVDGTSEFRKFGPRAMETIKQMAAMFSPEEAA